MDSSASERGRTLANIPFVSPARLGCVIVGLAALLSGCGDEQEPEPANKAPSFESPQAFNVSENTRRIASLSASDPEGTDVNLRISGGPDGALFRLQPGTGTLSFGADPDFEDPRDDDADNTYVARVTAEDAEGASTAILVAVTVLDLDEAPVIRAPGQIDVPEEQAYAYSIDASDPEGTPLSFSIEGGDDSGLFSIGTAGELRLDHVPDFEQPQDDNGDNYHEVVVGVRDGDDQLATHDLKVRVTEVNEAPTFTSSTSASVPENDLSVATLSASDPEGEALTFSVGGGEDGSLFGVDADTGDLKFLQAPDYESPQDTDGDNRYQLEAVVMDYRGAEARQTIEVEVTDKTRDIQSSLVFPPSGAHFGGRVEEFALVGRLTDLEGGSITHSDINYIEVDGQRISPDTGDASKWHARVPAERRNGEILVEVSMAGGDVYQSTLVLRNEPFFRTTSITTDPGHNRALLPGIRDSGQVVGVDLAQHDRMLVGECPGIYQIDYLVLDDSGEQVIVAARSESGVPSLWSVNIDSSGCTRLSGDGAGSGPGLGTIAGLELDEDTGDGENERIFVLNSDDDTVMVVDKQTGERSVFAGKGTGTDPEFGGLSAIALDSASYRAILPVTGSSNLVEAMDLGTGVRSTLAAHPGLADESPVAVNSLRDEAYVVNSSGDIDAVSTVDGQVEQLTGTGSPGATTYIGQTGDLELDARSGRLLIATEDQRPTGRLLFARTHSGDKGLVTSNTVAQGPAFGHIQDMAVDKVAGRAYVLDQGGTSGIVEVNLNTGERTRQPLDQFAKVISLVHDFAQDRLFVLGKPADGANPFHLAEIALPGYHSRVISRFDASTGPDLSAPRDIALNKSNSQLIIADAGLDAVLTVAPDSGEHQVLSGASHAGPALDQVRDILVDNARDRLIVVEANRGLLAVDIASGNRTDMLPAEPDGSHPGAVFESITLDDSGSTPLVVGIGNGKVQKVDPASDTIDSIGEYQAPPGQSLDSMPAVSFSPLLNLLWAVGDSGRVIVMSRESGQWAVLSR